MKRVRTALITGATGFIGSHLAIHLLQKKWRVNVLCRGGAKKEVLSRIKRKIKFHLFDNTFGSVDLAIKKSKPDVVFHLASLFIPEHTPDDIEPLFNSNLIFSTQLVESMVKNKTNFLINVGTSWQHFKSNTYNPVCLYAATKQAFEAVLKYYVETSSLHVTTLKLFDTYGPGDPRKKLFYSLEKAALENRKLKMSPGRQKIDLVYIDDVVKAFSLAAEAQFSGRSHRWEVFSVNTRKPHSLKEVVTAYEKNINKKNLVQWAGRPYRQREVMVPWRGARWVPGWKPQVNLISGLEKMERLS